MEKKMKKIYSCIGLIECAVFIGCKEKPEGPQTIIIELSDPEDVWETEQETEHVSDWDTEAEKTGMSVPDTEGTDEEPDIEETEAERLQLEGLDDGIRLEYTHIGSDDPMVSLVAAGLLPDDVSLKDFVVTNIQAYRDDEEIVPAGEIVFSLAGREDAQVVLYRLDEDGELVKETLEAADGMVSYQTQGCGRWLVLDADMEQETETESTSETEGVKK